MNNTNRSGLVFYTATKYLEVLFLAVMGYVVASKFGPQEYGKLASYLIAVTYSAYALLGVNQFVVKRVSTGQLTIEIGISRMLFYFLFATVLTSIYFGAISGHEHRSLLFLVVLVNLFRSICIALARVNDSMRHLSLSNFLASLIFVLFALFFIDTIQKYLISWAVINCVASIVLIYGLRLKLSSFSNVLKFRNHLDGLFESLAFVLTGLITTYFLTAERFILIRIESSNKILGIYQFADQISLALYIGLSSMVFFYTPKIYSHYNGNTNIGSREIKVLGILIMIAPIFAYVLAISCQALLRHLLPEFVGSYIPIFQTILAKTYLVLLVSLSTIMIAKSMQVFYIIFMSVLIGINYAIMNFFNDYTYIIGFNLISLLFSVLVMINKLKNVKSYDF